MTAQMCNYSRQAEQYAACALEDLEAESFDSHLEECHECRQMLASVIERGVAPEWLNWCREPWPFEKSPDNQPDADQEAWTEIATSDTASTDAPASCRRYQKIRQVGAGGMGVVWEGWDTVMRRKVALKTLRTVEHKGHAEQRHAEQGHAGPARAGQTTHCHRLLQEAASLARLSHPNIVSVFELFMTNEQPTMVMEFVDGPTLAQWRGDRVISERQAARLLEALAQAAQHAHENGVIHRDLKPSNVLLSFPRDQRDIRVNLDLATPKLSDFGLSRIAEDPSMTLAGDLIGTPAFMAPEQARGDVSMVSPATDVYGLGATLYDLLTGTPPHVAADPIATLELVCHHDPISPRALRPELSKDIETICMKCLRKSPAERYPSAAAFSDDLRALLEGRAIVARPQRRIAIAVRWCRRHKLLAGSMFMAAGLLIALATSAIAFAKTEQSLRRKADAAAIVADEAKARAWEQSKRAEAATQRIQEHFRITMGAVDNIAHLLNAFAVDPDVSPKAISESLRLDAIAIYAEYLKSLPAHDLWTFRDINVALRHAELVVQLSPQRLKECRRNVEALVPVMQRLEREHSDHPDTNVLLCWHARTLANFASNDGDPLSAAPWYARQAQCIQRVTEQSPDDLGQLREHGDVLFTASLCYFHGGNHQEALRFANESAEVAGRLKDRQNGEEGASFFYLHKLGWVANVAHHLGDHEKLRHCEAQMSELWDSFGENSPHRNELDSMRAHLANLFAR